MNGKETSVEENENWRQREWSYLCRNNMPIWKTEIFEHMTAWKKQNSVNMTARKRQIYENMTIKN